MTGLFCFDGPLYKDKNGVYCNVTLTNEMFNRYFQVVDELVIIVRTYSRDKSYIEMNMQPLDLDGIKVIEVDNLNSLSGITYKKKKFKKKIKNVLQQVDLIFARMPSTTSDVILSVAKKINKEYLVEVGGCAWDAFWNHGVLGKIIAPYMYINERNNIKNAAYAIYVTKFFLQKRYPNDHITTSCSNVYINEQSEAVLTKRIEKINDMNLNEIVLGQAVNSIDVKYKGEHLIVKVLKQLKESGIRAEFQIVGPGEGIHIKKEAQKYGVYDQVRILGTLNKQEINNWYKEIDLYVQPSKQEGLPRSVIEAMNRGCPCVGSRIAGIPELLDQSCLFNPNNITDIYNCIINLLEKKNLIKQSEKNFVRAKEYNLNVIETRRQNIFNDYCKRVKNYNEYK